MDLRDTVEKMISKDIDIASRRSAQYDKVSKSIAQNKRQRWNEAGEI